MKQREKGPRDLRLYKSSFIILLVCCVAVSVFVYYFWINMEDRQNAKYSNIESCTYFMADDLQAQCMDGRVIDADFIRSHDMTVLNIWATFCSSCVEEMPDLELISKDDPDHVAVLGMLSDIFYSDGSIDEAKVERGQNIMEKTGATYPMIIAGDEILSEVFSQVTLLPTTLFIDNTGRIFSVMIGGKTADQWREIISEKLVLAMQEG